MNSKNRKNEIWSRCYKLFHECVQKGVTFAENGGCEEYHAISAQRTEYAVNSRYLHRGFYSPSPVFWLVLENSRKGKLLKKPTKRGNITHLYKLDNQGELYYIEYYTGNHITGREYIIRENNVRYGYVFDNSGLLGGVSVEIWENDLLREYMWSPCRISYLSQNEWESFRLHYESYQYNGSKISSFECCFVALIEEDFKRSGDATGLVDIQEYQPRYEDNQIVDLLC